MTADMPDIGMRGAGIIYLIIMVLIWLIPLIIGLIIQEHYQQQVLQGIGEQSCGQQNQVFKEYIKNETSHNLQIVCIDNSSQVRGLQ